MSKVFSVEKLKEKIEWECITLLRLAVVGSRSCEDYELVSGFLGHFINQKPIIVSGGAKGVDSLAERFADENELKKKIYKADWSKYGRAAGPIRNQQIVDNANAMIAFATKDSKGTKNSVKLAVKKGIPVLVVNI
jgi:hypothetical protein